ncbi:MAG: pyridoxamine 5'-phosphate oxidase family protein [Planctomycetes bacterium]|nr:pyridoxamine 5'-phosphate oxidase family protein [Planctomycetota bacterium]
MKIFSLLMTGVFACGLLGCGNPPTTPESTTAQIPIMVRGQPALVRAPDFYQGELAWTNVEYVLHSSAVGRLVTNDGDNPYSVPVSFGYCRERIYFHSSTMGKKMNNIVDNPKVAFVVDRYNEREGWASISIFGTARIVEGPEETSLALQRFSAAYKNPPDEIEAKAAQVKPEPLPPMELTMVEITPAKITSRLLPVSLDLMAKMPYMTDSKIPDPGNQPLSPEDAQVFTGVLPADTVKWLLNSGAWGRLNIFAGDYPDSEPVIYYYRNGSIYIDLKNDDSLIALIKKDGRVSFSLDRITDDLSDWKAGLPALGGKSHSRPLTQTAGLWLWLSINVFGDAQIIFDPTQALTHVRIKITPRLITSKASHMPLTLPKMVYTFKEPLLLR